MRTVRHYVDLRAARSARRTYLLTPENGLELTFGQLRREACNLSRFLAGMGLARGDKVGLYLPNGCQTAMLLLGTMNGGFVAAPFNLLAQGEQLAYVLEHSDAKIVFTSRDNEARLGEALARVPRPIEAIVIDPDAPSLFLEHRLPHVAPYPVEEDDPALLMYTSGTTGRPKGCLLTQKNVVSGGLFVAEAHALGERDRVLSSLPLYHINGQIVATVGPLVQGGSVVCPRRFSVSAFWQMLAAYRCTWFNVVPTIISYLAAATNLEGTQPDLSAVRFGRSASAPLAPELHRSFEAKFGISIIETMGMTETAAPVFSNPLERAKRKYGSVGVPVGNAGKVIRADGGECAPLEIGEVMVRGDNVMREYYKNPQETAKAFTRDGWLHTGDLGYVDAEGYFFITGRLKELIIKGGENIAPREIDDALYKHPAVLEAAAVGIPDAHYGQEIFAGVVFKPGASASEAELRAFCERELGAYKTPKVFRVFDALPKGPSGKVQRLKLLDAP